MYDLLSNILIGLVTGLVSGLISGGLVSKYFNKKQDKEKWRRDFSEDKQNLSRFIDVIKNEIEVLIIKRNKEEEIDTTEVRRIITKDYPRTYSFSDTLDGESEIKMSVFSSLMREVETISNQVTLSELMDYKKRLSQSQMAILSLTTVIRK